MDPACAACAACPAWQLRHTSLSCVHYAPGDSLGKGLAHIALAPLLVLVWQASRVYARREPHEAFLLLGLILEEAAVLALKAAFRHPRPAASCEALRLCQSHGMPSSHTSLMFAYLAATSVAAAAAWSHSSRTARLLSLVEQGGCLAVSAAVAWSRVYLGYHSVDQVLAGAAFGIAFGLALAVAVRQARPLYTQLVGLPLLQALGVKDTAGCAEPLLLEQAAHSRAGGRQQAKKAS